MREPCSRPGGRSNIQSHREERLYNTSLGLHDAGLLKTFTACSAAHQKVGGEVAGGGDDSPSVT